MSVERQDPGEIPEIVIRGVWEHVWVFVPVHGSIKNKIMDNAHTSVEVFLYARGLPRLDAMSRSDPFCVVYRQGPTGAYVEVSRTDTVLNNHNPDFAESFTVEFNFEEDTTLHLEVYDRDCDSDELHKHDHVGSTCDFTLGRLVGSKAATGNMVMSLPLLRKGMGRGVLTMRAKEVGPCRDQVTLHLGGMGLRNKSWLRGSNPSLEIARVCEDGATSTVWRSSVARKTLNPTWDPAVISVQTLCNGDLDRGIHVKIVHNKPSGGLHAMGEVRTSLSKIMRARELPVIEKKKIHRRGYVNSGYLRVIRKDIHRPPTFLEYLTRGCTMSMVTAVDFTTSNGSPTDPTSLHYRSGVMNKYQVAMYKCGTILQEYDPECHVNMYGFGGREKGNRVDHCLDLAPTPHPRLRGVPEMLANYNNIFPRLILSFPTLFSPVLTRVIRDVRGRTNQSCYTVLLIITDGAITQDDMQPTVDLIVDASSLPISIIIVGVGQNDFSAMRRLDAASIPLRHTLGKYCERDIVKFVHLEDNMSDSKLSRELLAEVPRQFEAYMHGAPSFS
jgi:hypothetical protein